ncbi:MAG: DNA polymerase [Euryarchaeota archaeon]|nr:DNA polymerase [Euryarchaeota archaeon]|tara:strand:- start:18416 stop:18793 length:378 start_codon:yes stop_codon:yes gene_type:complete
MNPFQFVNEITFGKKDVMVDPDVEKKYSPFMVNRSLSYFPDTVYMANEMNRYHHLDGKLQFQFLLNIVRKRKRFSKWVKPETDSNVDVIKEYYGYSNEKAIQALPLLSTSQLNIIKNKVNKGGRK